MGHWQPADHDRCASVWNAELATIPDFETSTLHMVSGLLLPIWRQLPKESSRVYRLQTDVGERIIGPQVSAGRVAVVVGAAPRELPEAQGEQLLQEGRAVLQFAVGEMQARVRGGGDG